VNKKSLTAAFYAIDKFIDLSGMLNALVVHHLYYLDVHHLYYLDVTIFNY